MKFFIRGKGADHGQDYTSGGLYTLVPTAFLRRAQPPDGKVAVEFHAGDALEACQQL